MKDLRPALFEYLLADNAIMAAVDGGMFPSRMPQGRRHPSIVYSEVSNVGFHTFQGPLGFARPRFQIDAWAETPDAASYLSNLVKERLDGFKGTMGTAPNAVTVQGALFQSSRDDYDPEADLYRRSTDYLIMFVERD